MHAHGFTYSVAILHAAVVPCVYHFAGKPKHRETHTTRARYGLRLSNIHDIQGVALAACSWFVYITILGSTTIVTIT